MPCYVIPVSVKTSLFLREPLPCKTTAETPFQPLIWCFSSELSQKPSLSEECFSQTVTTTTATTICLGNLIFSDIKYRTGIETICGYSCSGYGLLVLHSELQIDSRKTNNSFLLKHGFKICPHTLQGTISPYLTWLKQ